MTELTIPVFVNERAVHVGRGASVLAAVQAADAALGAQVLAGAAIVTDARALPLAATDPVASGAILRVRAAARAAAGEADASA